MAFYTAGLTAEQWMWCIFLGLGSLLWGQVYYLYRFLLTSVVCGCFCLSL